MCPELVEGRAIAMCPELVEGRAIAMCNELVEGRAIAMCNEPVERRAIAMCNEPVERRAIAMCNEPVERRAIAMCNEPVERRAIAMCNEPVERTASHRHMRLSKGEPSPCALSLSKGTDTDRLLLLPLSARRCPHWPQGQALRGWPFAMLRASLDPSSGRRRNAIPGAAGEWVWRGLAMGLAWAVGCRFGLCFSLYCWENSLFSNAVFEYNR